MKPADFKRNAPRWAEWLVIVVLMLCAAGGLYALLHPPTFTERELDVRVVRRTVTQVDESATARAERLEREVERWRTLATKRTKRVEEPVVVACDGGAPVIASKITEETVEQLRAEGERAAASVTSSTSTSTRTARVEEHVDEQRREVTKARLSHFRFSGGVGWAIGVKPALQLRDGLTLGGVASFRIPFENVGLPTQYGVWLGFGGSTVGEVRILDLGVEF